MTDNSYNHPSLQCCFWLIAIVCMSGSWAQHTVQKCGFPPFSTCPSFFLNCSTGIIQTETTQYQDFSGGDCGSPGFSERILFASSCFETPNCSYSFTNCPSGCPCVMIEYGCVEPETTTTTSTTTSTSTSTSTSTTTDTSTTTATSTDSSSNSSSTDAGQSGAETEDDEPISTYVYVGIGVGAFVILTVPVLVACILRRRGKADGSAPKAVVHPESNGAAETGADKKGEVTVTDKPGETIATEQAKLEKL